VISARERARLRWYRSGKVNATIWHACDVAPGACYAVHWRPATAGQIRGIRTAGNVAGVVIAHVQITNICWQWSPLPELDPPFVFWPLAERRATAQEMADVDAAWPRWPIFVNWHPSGSLFVEFLNLSPEPRQFRARPIIVGDESERD
jgi:hypothetical protein